MKKMLAMILAALMLTATACGTKGETPADTTAAATTGTTVSDTAPAVTEPAEVDILDELGEKSFGGRVFTVLDANDYPDMHINIPGKEICGETIRDAVYTRDTAIE